MQRMFAVVEVPAAAPSPPQNTTVDAASGASPPTPDFELPTRPSPSPAPKNIPPYAQQLSSHSFCIYLRDDFTSAHTINLLSCVLTDHGYLIGNVGTTEDGVAGSAAVASVNTQPTPTATPAVNFKTGAHPVKGNLLIVEFAGDHNAQSREFKDSSAAKVIGIIGNVAKIGLVSVLGLASVVGGVAIGGVAASITNSAEVLALGIGGGVVGFAKCADNVKSTAMVVKEDFMSTFGMRDKSKPLAHMYAAAAGGYTGHTIVPPSISLGGGSDGGGAAAASVSPTIDLDSELPVILPVHSFEYHAGFRDYFFKNLAVYCFNAGATRVPDETVHYDFKHGAVALQLGGAAQAGKLPFLGTKLFKLTVALPPQQQQHSDHHTLLQVEVHSEENVKVRVRSGAPPSRFTPKTTVAKRTGPESWLATLANPAAGTWYVSVSSVSATEYSVAANLATIDAAAAAAAGVGSGSICNAADGIAMASVAMPLPAFYGTVQTRSVQETADAGGDWELVDCTPVSPTEPVVAIDIKTHLIGGAGIGADADASPVVASAPPDPDAPLTQQTDLFAVSSDRLRTEIVARGGVIPIDGTLLTTDVLAGLLFPLLPPGMPLAASVSAAHPATRADSNTSIDDSDIPRAFVCPITCDIFEDPVFTADGMTYEREAIATWLLDNRTSPLTNARLPHTNLVPNFSRARLIKQWRSSIRRK